MTARRVVGSAVRRVGGVERVTGTQRYVADIAMPDVLHVKLVTLDTARARIHSVDKKAAESHPAVAFVMTPDDLPEPMPRFGPVFQDRPVLAIGETRYHGEPVAAVAAETLQAAEMAAKLVKVEAEELPGVYSVEAALDPGSPLVQDPLLREGPHADRNTLSEHRYGWGDVDTAACDLVVDKIYAFPMVTQFAIEPHAFMAAPDNGGIAIWSSVQHPFLLQKTLASLLDLPLAKVRVHAPDPGGGFGGKQNPKYEPLLAFMALRSGRPVRLVLTLAETFQTVRRSAAEMKVRTGVRADGTIVFQDIEANFLIGAYADIAYRVVSKSSYLAGGPYRVPNVRIIARALLSNTTPSTAMRGFGAPQLGWARESNIDEAARRLGIDPVELRLRNLPDRGEEFIPDETPADGIWSQTVTEAAELLGWGSPLGPGRGRGLALGIKSGPTSGLSYATVRLLADGSAVVYSGTSDMGQGARTIFAQIVAEELGCPIDSVSVVMGDTSLVPYDQQTSASRSSVLMGNAILRACEDIQFQLRARIAELSGVEIGGVTVDQGTVSWSQNEMSISRAVDLILAPMGGELIGNGEVRVDSDETHPLGGRAVFFELNCAAAEVEVDSETGEISLIRYVTVGDAGGAINPMQVAGQDEGAAIMGLGHTLMEQMILDDRGRILNMGAVDYDIPTTMDLPEELVSATIENADGPGPYGIKGVSEGSLLATAPAVAAAVASATGVVIRDLPLTPERIWRAIQETR